MLRRTKTILSVLILTAPLWNACEKKEDDKKSGKAIGAPAVEPPVSRNLPAGITKAELLLTDDAQSTKTIAINALKDLISPTGNFVGIVQRLEKIDERMAELDKRAQDSQKACLAESNEAEAYNIGGAFAGDQNIEMKFQCQENLEGPSGKIQQLAFGLADNKLFLMEQSKGSFSIFANAPLNGNGVTIWQVGTDDEHKTFTQITASDDDGFEATVAGTDTSGNTSASACGIHFRSSKNLIYMAASVTADSGCSTTETFCLKASDLTDVDESRCEDAKLTTFELTSLTPDLSEQAGDEAEKIVNKAIKGFIDFTKDAEVAE